MAHHTPAGFLVDVDDLPFAAVVVDRRRDIVHANAALRSLTPVTSPRFVDLFPGSRRDRVEAFLDSPIGTHTTVLSGPVDPVAVELHALAGSTENERVVIVTPTSIVGDAALDDVVSAAYDIVGKGLIVGGGTHLLYVSEAAAKLFGRPAEEIVALGSAFPLFTEAEQKRLLAEAQDLDREDTASMAEDAGVEVIETVIERPDGTEQPVEIWKRAVVFGPKVRTVTVIGDNATRRRRFDRLAQMATIDPLTSLPNRRLLIERLDDTLDSVQGTAAALLLFIDLDDFKEINDRYGHQIGDDVLRITAKRLRSCLRECDTAARLGGDEFAVLREAQSEHGATDSIVHRIQASPREPIVAGSVTVNVGASVGTARLDRRTGTAADALAEADAAMYAVKRRRRITGS